MNTQKSYFNLLHTCIVIFFTLLSSTSISAQVWQVDSRIDTITVVKSGGYYILDIVVKADNDDDARAPKLIVSLPRNCRVNGINMPSGMNGTAYKILGNQSQTLASGYNPPRTDAHIQFDLTNLGTSTNITFQISFSASTAGLQSNSKVSAFIYSMTPEFNKDNNFKSIVIQ